MKGYRDNGGGAGGFGARSKTVYDDVFGGPPKFGATTLPPRLEDYTEIFQGFHASRGSSIPVLDLPPPSDDSDDVWFDVRSSKLDYSEVFGGFNGLDFAVSYDELFKSSKVGDDNSSDEIWTPAQSESLSDESDPYASLEMNQQVSTADTSQLFGVKLQNEPKLEAKKDVHYEMTNESQCLDVPGSTLLDSQALPSKLEKESLFSLANNDLCASKDFGEVAEGKKLKKSLSQPLNSACGTERYGVQKDYYVGNRPPLSVSDLSLKTQPSHLPPPSRPPPAIISKKGGTCNFNSTLKTSKSYAFERMTGGQSPPYFDVEIDASSSAAADAAAMKDAVEQAQAKLNSAKELMNRKKDSIQSRSKMRMENNLGDKKVRINEDYEKFNGSRSLERENTIREESQKDAGTFELNASSMWSKKNNDAVLESFEQKEDGKIVQERELCGLVENNKGQETRDMSIPSVAQMTFTLGETEKRASVSQQHGDIKASNDSDENESYENLIEIQLKDNDMETVERVVTENWFTNDNGRKGDNDMGPAAYFWEDYDVGLEESIEKEHEKGVNETKEQDEKEFQQLSPPAISMVESQEEDHHNREEDKRLVEAFEQEESDNISETASEQDENKKEQTLDHNEKILQEECEIKAERDDNLQTPKYASEHNENKKEHTLDHNEKILQEEDIIKAERDDNLQTLNHAEENEEINTTHDMNCNSDEDRKLQDWNGEESEEVEDTVLENDGIQNEQITSENLETSDLVFQVDDNEILQVMGGVQQDIQSKKHEPIAEIPCLEKIKETVEEIHKVGEQYSNQNDLHGVKVEVRTTDVTYSNLSTYESAGKANSVNVIGQAPIENDQKTSESKNCNNVTCNQADFSPEERTTTTTTKPVTDQAESLRNTSAASKVAGGGIERKAVLENRGKEERLQRVRELENERLRKIEEERERQIEREKDRMAVDRATLEAREMTFAETRERAERAAVERATAEFRQRALAEARERLEKACAEARERSLADKVMEGRLRVEKATAEARERAERSLSDKYSAYQNTGIRQNSLPADLSGSYGGLRYSQTAAQSVVGEGESPQRCKARLERHQRTADRAAKALAEKNMRDLIAQKEQAERSRLAEGLDAEVKRWSSGKQGNLRALLSTLQYILGPDSGWHPVPLTEVITTAAVKKAYRKATLCVHPDKLQQRGATIQQKYICEKVFDLLKEAWNKFNSEER